MKRLVWTPLALEDLERISAYLESKSNLETADRVCTAIYDTVQRLRQFSELGRQGREHGTREMVIAPFPAYIVVYRLAPYNTVQVLRVWHGAQGR